MEPIFGKFCQERGVLGMGSLGHLPSQGRDGLGQESQGDRGRRENISVLHELGSSDVLSHPSLQPRVPEEAEAQRAGCPARWPSATGRGCQQMAAKEEAFWGQPGNLLQPRTPTWDVPWVSGAVRGGQGRGRCEDVCQVQDGGLWRGRGSLGSEVGETGRRAVPGLSSSVQLILSCIHFTNIY